MIAQNMKQQTDDSPLEGRRNGLIKKWSNHNIPPVIENVNQWWNWYAELQGLLKYFFL